jgi:hypothetical protein
LFQDQQVNSFRVNKSIVSGSTSKEFQDQPVESKVNSTEFHLTSVGSLSDLGSVSYTDDLSSWKDRDWRGTTSTLSSGKKMNFLSNYV